MQQGRTKEALVELRKAANKSPKDTEAWIWLGRAYLQSDSLDSAILALSHAKLLEPKNPAVHEALGDVYMKQGGAMVGISQYEQAVALDSSRATLQQKPDYLKGHLYLAHCYTQIDSFPQVKRESEMVIKLAASNGVNGNNGDSHKEELAEAHSLIGFVLLRDKNYPKALEAFNASIRLVNNNPQTRLWRAQTLALSGKREEAIAEYNAVLKLDPNNQTAKKDLTTLAQQ